MKDPVGSFEYLPGDGRKEYDSSSCTDGGFPHNPPEYGPDSATESTVAPKVTIWRGTVVSDEPLSFRPRDVVYRRTVTPKQQAELDRLKIIADTAKQHGTDSAPTHHLASTALRLYKASLTEVFDVERLQSQAGMYPGTFRLCETLGISVSK